MATASCSYIRPLVFEIEKKNPVPWTNSAQEAHLHHEYPFLEQAESAHGGVLNGVNDDETLSKAHDYVIRRYLETLWLPESIHPLAHLVHTLRRVHSPREASNRTCTESEHPLHALLSPILLSTRTASDKYNFDLARILEEGGDGDECELEESMMWYAWGAEKEEEDTKGMTRETEGGGNDGDNARCGKESEEWRKRWLRKLEKRETMIQILLYLLVLSLPGPFPLPASSMPDPSNMVPHSPSEHALLSPSKRSSAHQASPKKSKKSKRDDYSKARAKHREETLAVLESYMDKLTVWQLTEGVEGWLGGIGGSGSGGGSSQKDKGKVKDDRDWTQAFCEDVVEKLFKDVLPDQTSLLRSKLFPTSPFDGSDDDSDLDSFEKKSRANSKAKSRAGSTLSNDTAPKNSRKRALSRTSSRASVTSSQDTQSQSQSAFKRSRSRSLSVSLAQDEAEQRKSLVTGEGRTRKLSREVSMKRVVKVKVDKKKNASTGSMQRAVSSVALPMKRSQSHFSAGVTLVQDTPVKRQRTWDAGDFAGSAAAVGPSNGSSSYEAVVIEDTPERKRVKDVDVEAEVEAVVVEDTPDRLKKQAQARQTQTQTQARGQAQSRIQDFLKTPTRDRNRAVPQHRVRQGGQGGRSGMSKSYISLLGEEGEDDEEEDDEANVSLTPKARPRPRLATTSRSQQQPRTESRPQAQSHRDEVNADYDELADESFTESFGSPDVLLLESSPVFPGASMAESTPSVRRKRRGGRGV